MIQEVLGRRHPLEWLLWGALLAFSLHNVLSYNPNLGYDGPSHLLLLRSFSLTGHMPESGYGSSNPPLYYFLMGQVYRLTQSEKWVQFFSWILFCAQVFLFRALVLRLVTRRWIANVMVFFYATLPLTIEYSVMVMNYSLGHFLTLFALYLFVRILENPSISPGFIYALIGTVVLGVLVSLTGLAVWATAFPFLLFWVPKPKSARRFYAATLLLVSMLGLGTWAWQRQEKLGCVLCTTHRAGGGKAKFHLFDPKVYFRVSGLASPAWEKPFYPNGFGVSLPMILFETFYSDYFNYLIPGYLEVNPENHQDWAFTGLHFADPRRQWQFRAQVYLGAPLFLFFIFSLFKQGGQGERPRLSNQKRTFWFFTFLTVMQFLVYIHRYRDFVNWHAGYLYPIAFLGCGIVARQWDKYPKQGKIMAPIFLLYSVLNLWVFWL